MCAYIRVDGYGLERGQKDLLKVDMLLLPLPSRLHSGVRDVYIHTLVLYPSSSLLVSVPSKISYNDIMLGLYIYFIPIFYDDNYTYVTFYVSGEVKNKSKSKYSKTPHRRDLAREGHISVAIRLLK